MLKYLIKSTQEIRVETEEAADDLHKQMAEEALKMNAVLTSWTETKKEQKAKGEIIATWYICKYTFLFNDPKEPVIPLESIEYNMKEDVPW